MLLLQIEKQIELEHEWLTNRVGSISAAECDSNLNKFKPANVCADNLVFEVWAYFVGEEYSAGELCVHSDVAIAFGNKCTKLVDGFEKIIHPYVQDYVLRGLASLEDVGGLTRRKFILGRRVWGLRVVKLDW